MTLTDAQDYIRTLRQPPFDDADSDYDFVRMWERRHRFFAGVFFVFAAVLASFGFETAPDVACVLYILAFAVDQEWQCRRFRQMWLLFEDQHQSSSATAAK